MAATTYRRDTVTESGKLYARKKQGCPPKAKALKQTKRVTANLTENEHAEFTRQRESESMSEAAYAAKAIRVYLFVTNNS